MSFIQKMTSHESVLKKTPFLPAGTSLRVVVSFAAILLMLTGFFVSRAILSMSMILFGIAALWGIRPRRWLENTWWLLGVVWVGLFAVSGCWSEDISYWWEHVQVKLPILLLPLSFYFLPAFPDRFLRIFTIVLSLLLLIAIGYSSYHLAQNPETYIEGYNYANILPTIPQNDHIRFSMMLAFGIAWLLYRYPSCSSRLQKGGLVLLILLFSLWLHILAARAGLAALYLILLALLGRLIWKRSTRMAGIGLTVLFSFLIAAAFIWIPTLKHRIGHFKYSLLVFQQGEMAGNYNDIGRYMSYDIALKLIREHPLTGVGAGDIMSSMKAGYDRWYPHVPDPLRLVPHNQFLVGGLATGIPGMVLFALWVFYPLFSLPRNRGGFFTAVIWSIMLIPLMVEPMLEIQFGVFVYLFPFLWQQQAASAQNRLRTTRPE